MQLVEAQKAIELESYLREEYLVKGRRLREIGADLGLDTGTISRWMLHFGIATRTRTVA